MAAADHDDIVVFHVKPSLTDAEAGENLAQQVVNIHSADEGIQCPDSLPQMLRRQLDARVGSYHFRP
jgi:hypothetical protein